MATFKRRGSPIRTPDLRRTVEDFARRLRSKFHSEIELDAGQFKRRAVGLLRQNLPLRPGRPCSYPVTRAFRLRAKKIRWSKVYRACLPAFADMAKQRNTVETLGFQQRFGKLPCLLAIRKVQSRSQRRLPWARRQASCQRDGFRPLRLSNGEINGLECGVYSQRYLRETAATVRRTTMIDTRTTRNRFEGRMGKESKSPHFRAPGIISMRMLDSIWRFHPVMIGSGLRYFGVYSRGNG